MNILEFKRKKAAREKISMFTCYDYPSARIIENTEVDIALVGDSVAMTVHGHESTVMATMEMMVLHTKAVKRGTKKQFIVSDLPFLSYHASLEKTFENVQALMQAGAHAVKLEGATEENCHTIQAITKAGIPVMGHIGLTPQSVHQLGGYKVQGRESKRAAELIEAAHALERAGCFAIVIECVPEALAAQITEALSIPTIGIGAGPHTDGQVLVWHDALGLHSDLSPRFVKQFAKAQTILSDAITQYTHEVSNQTFPAKEHCYA